MKSKKMMIPIAVVAAGIVCVGTALGLKMKDAGSPTIEPVENVSEIAEPTEEYSLSEDYSAPSASISESPSAPAAGVTAPLSVPASQTVPGASVPDTSSLSVTQKITQVARVVNREFQKIFTMPKAPKYVPPDVNIDFEKANLASYKYDPNGNYYYTDDKDCWQKNFGYTPIYDRLAVVGQMLYDTVRTTFTYGGKDWMIQIWKGQYGFYFVGGEVGVYTKKAGSGGNTYACADKEDWLNMEMCFIWDENHNGNYEPVFNRPYTKYWWCTGFVIGFESAASRTDRSQFRLVTHITFKDTEMANAFCSAFEANGFRRVSSFNAGTVDTFVQSGADVGFVWQSINQNVI